MRGAGAVPSLRERLWGGEVLRVLFAEEVGFDVWVEKYGNPPRVYFEGRALPVEEFERVLERIGRYLEEDGIHFTWNGKIPDIRMPQGAA